MIGSRVIFMAGLILPALAGCGRRGDLRAPQRGVPAPPELQARQAGDELRLRVTHHGLREDGKPVSGPETALIELTAGAFHRVETVTVENHGAGLRLPLPPGAEATTVTARWRDGRGRISSPSPAVIFSAKPQPEAIARFTAESRKEGLQLSFSLAPGAQPRELRLYEETPAGETLLAAPAISATGWPLGAGRDGETRHLRLRALYQASPVIESAGLALDAVWDDHFPPPPPENVQAFPGAAGIELYFPAPQDPDAVTAVLERRQDAGAFAEIARFPAAEGHYLDSGAPPGVALEYRLRFADGARTPNLSTPVTVSGRRPLASSAGESVPSSTPLSAPSPPPTRGTP